MPYRKPGTMHGRFPHVNRDSGPVLYVGEFSNGVVKIGYTGHPRMRLSSCLTEARKYFGRIDLQRFYVTPFFKSRADALAAERAALNAVPATAKPATHLASEFFVGLTFEEAVQLVPSPTEPTTI